MRADALRNRERLLAAAGELLASRGHEVTMEEIAAEAGVGLGTLYRNFASKQAMLIEIVRQRYRHLIELAERAEAMADPGDAFDAVVTGFLELAEGDAAFQRAMLSEDLEWEGVAEQKEAFAAPVSRIIAAGVAAGSLRADLTFTDVPMLVCGVMATMYFRPGVGADWRRHLALALAGTRPGS
ncbi:MAG TPA: helix-turn-helix domain-containing protein [Cellulomonas sp.]